MRISAAHRHAAAHPIASLFGSGSAQDDLADLANPAHPAGPAMAPAVRFTVSQMFATPIASAVLRDAAALDAALLPAILARQAAYPGVRLSNQGGWQSEGDFAAWSGAAGQVLVREAAGLADRLTAQHGAAGFERTPPVWRIDAWANVNHAGCANSAHHHGGAFWSGVYWVDAGDDGCGGELELLDPRGILPAFANPHLRMALPGCLSAGGSDFFEPESGTLVLFPAWLVHAVRPYRGTRPRVSVAFNFSA